MRRAIGAVLKSMLMGVIAASGVAVWAADSSREAIAALNELSSDLVARAASRRADATRFRIDSTLYREGLRELMLDTQGEDAGPDSDRSLFLDMVRMSALLHAAAECKTGRYIVCPADLMLQLKSQQETLDARIRAGPD